MLLIIVSVMFYFSSIVPSANMLALYTSSYMPGSGVPWNVRGSCGGRIYNDVHNQRCKVLVQEKKPHLIILDSNTMINRLGTHHKLVY